MKQDNESIEVFDAWLKDLPQYRSNGSGIPAGFEFESFGCIQAWQDGRIYIYPPDGGLIILNRDGTWVGDCAPFAD